MDINANSSELQKERQELIEKLKVIEATLQNYPRNTERYKRAEVLLQPTKDSIARIDSKLGIKTIVQGQLSRQKDPFKSKSSDEQDMEL